MARLGATGIRSLQWCGSCFYLRDGLLEVWFAVMVDAIALDAPPASWKWRLEDDFRYQATLVFDGLVATNLDTHLSTDVKRSWFLDRCHAVRKALKTDDFVLGPFAQGHAASRWTATTRDRLIKITEGVMWLEDPDRRRPPRRAP